MGFHWPNLLEDGYDIRTVQEWLGHKDVATMMIYTYVLNRGSREVRTPAGHTLRSAIRFIRAHIFSSYVHETHRREERGCWLKK